MVSSFQIQRHKFEVRVFSFDSDWAGDRNEEIVKRRSCPRGTTFLKAYIRKTEKNIARSSAEAELYAAALGASEAKGVESMLGDLGFVVEPEF